MERRHDAGRHLDQRAVPREPDRALDAATTGRCSAAHPTRASRPTARRRSRSACRRPAPAPPARNRRSPPGEHPGGAVHAHLARPPHGRLIAPLVLAGLVAGCGTRRTARAGRAVGPACQSVGDQSARRRASNPPRPRCHPIGPTTMPDRPRLAAAAGCDACGARRSRAARRPAPSARSPGIEEGSDAPWIVPPSGAWSTPAGPLAASRSTRRSRPRRGRRAGRRSRRPAPGDVDTAPEGSGRVTSSTPDGRRRVEPPARGEVRRGPAARPGTGAWSVGVIDSRPTRNRRRSRGAGRARFGTAGSRAGPGQARAPAAVALKIETCASSGSITPKIFWSVRRWTQEPQLSK